MKAIVYTVSLIVSLGVICSVAVCAPDVLAENAFLNKFIEDQILNILAVIMTISVALIASIHIWFNELEDKHQKKVFGAARREVNQSAFLFIALFVAELIWLVVRSWFADNHMAVAFFDGIAMLILLASVFTLADLMAVVKALTVP